MPLKSNWRQWVQYFRRTRKLYDERTVKNLRIYFRPEITQLCDEYIRTMAHQTFREYLLNPTIGWGNTKIEKGGDFYRWTITHINRLPLWVLCGSAKKGLPNSGVRMTNWVLDMFMTRYFVDSTDNMFKMYIKTPPQETI